MKISQPPVPKPSANVEDVRRDVLALAEWVSRYSSWANDYAEGSGCPFSPFVPTNALENAVRNMNGIMSASVQDLFLTWFGCRRLREIFDMFARNNAVTGSIRDCDSHVQHMFARIVRTAFLLVENAPLSYERQEAKRMEQGLPNLSVDSYDLLQFVVDRHDPAKFIQVD